MLFRWPSFAAGALVLKERILEWSPGFKFSSIIFLFSYSAAEIMGSVLVSLSLTRECWAYSMSVVLLLGMNLSAPPWLFLPLYMLLVLTLPLLLKEVPSLVGVLDLLAGDLDLQRLTPETLSLLLGFRDCLAIELFKFKL